MSKQNVIYEWHEDMLRQGEFELHADGKPIGRITVAASGGFAFRDSTVKEWEYFRARSKEDAQAFYVKLVENRAATAAKCGETIAEMLADYKAQVISPTAPEIQVREVELAFWAGAMSLYRSVMLNLSSGPDSTTADLQYMIRLESEIQEYSVRARKIADSQPEGKQ